MVSAVDAVAVLAYDICTVLRRKAVHCSGRAVVLVVAVPESTLTNDAAHLSLAVSIYTALLQTPATRRKFA